MPESPLPSVPALPVGSPAADLARENEALRYQLEEAEELIAAIRNGSVDALAVQGPDGPRIFTLEGADLGYRMLIEQMNEGALLLGEDTTILYCNACLAGWLNKDLQEVIGCSFEAFVPLTFRQSWTELLAQAWQGKAKGELPLQAENGLMLPFLLSMNVLTFNEAPVLAIIITDLSAQREINNFRARVAEQNALIERTNEELKREEAARQAAAHTAAEASRVLEGIPHIAWTASPAGENTYLNQRWYDFIGEGKGAASPSLFRDLLHPDDLPLAIVRWQHSLRTGAPLDIECRIRNAAGEYRWMLGRALPSRNESGDIMQWIGAYTDIHEHKLAQQRIDAAQHQLQDNNEQLRRANIDLDNFIYTASHDLKAPIHNIEGLLHALLTELPAEIGNGATVQPILHMMQDSVDRFKRTIEHLTEVTKLQKEHEPSTDLVDLAQVVREVTLDLAPLIQEAHAALAIDVQTCPRISFSEKNLRSVVYNLLSNALKYRASTRPAQVRLFCRQEPGYVVLVVEDNGLGLNLAASQKLFTMFQRFHDHVEGSGIGLYMVKKIVENAGGRIQVQSQLDQGSTFAVYFRH